MLRRWKSCAMLVAGSALLVGCDSFEKDDAALQIRERFCNEWPYGCTDSTRVVVEKVNETRNGRQVEFRVVDREDETARLSAAYFEPSDDGWGFLLFENPFNDAFKSEASRFASDSRRFDEVLSELKAAQRWFVTIYGRYAQSFAELDSVSYKRPELPLEMDVDEESWHAEISSSYVQCELEVPRQQLPSCTGLAARNSGTKSGPLSEAFGEPN